MKVKYIGQSFGVFGLTNEKIYDCLGVEGPFLRIVDDSEEDYLYSAKTPGAMDPPYESGKWKIVEDSKDGVLRKAILGAPAPLDRAMP